MAPRTKFTAQDLLAAAAELPADERHAVAEAQVLALPVEQRAKVVARVQASLLEPAATTEAPAHAAYTAASPPPPRLLELAGTGTGLWGNDSTEYLRHLRDEWD